MGGDGGAITFAAEDVAAGDEAGEQASLQLFPKLLALRARFRKAGAETFAEMAFVGVKVVPREHGFNRLGVALGNPMPFGVFIEDVDVASVVSAGEEDDGAVGVTVVHGSKPLDGISLTEAMQAREFGKIVWVGGGRDREAADRCSGAANDMNCGTEIAEVLAGGEVPVALVPRGVLPAGRAGEVSFVIRIDEDVVHHPRGDEAGGGFVAGLKGHDEFLEIPWMADTAGIGGGIETGPPVRFGRAATSGDVREFAGGELGGLLNPDHVVLEAEISIDIFLALIMPEDDTGTVGEDELAARGVEFMRQLPEETLPESLEMLEIGFAHLAEEEAVETGDALAIVGAHLGEQPVGFTAAARAAVTDGGGATRPIAQSGCGTGGELAGLEDEAGGGEVAQLVLGTTELLAEPEELFEPVFGD